jgi:hypothetical protein
MPWTFNPATKATYWSDEDGNEPDDNGADINPVTDASRYGGMMGGWNKQWDKANYAGKFGMGLGAVGAVAGLAGMLGRKQGPSRYEIEQEALGRSGMGAANSYAGHLGGIGQQLETQGLHNQNMYRDRYMDEAMNPNNMQMDMASLAAQDSARQRGISSRFGMMGGNLGAARATSAAYNPGFAGGVANLIGGQRQRRMFANEKGAQWASSDFGQGMGMLNNAYNVSNAGRQNLGGVLGRLQAASDARRAARDQAMMGAVKGIGSLAGGGFG